jgi:hypothetical protein
VLRDDLVLAFDDFGIIEFRVFTANSLFFAVLEIFPDLGRVQQSLGGHAPHVQAGPAELRVFLHDGRPQAVLAGAYRRRVAPRTATDDYQIVGH